MPVTNLAAERWLRETDEPVSSAWEFIGRLELRFPTRLYYFRGEPQRFASPCMPSIWRDTDVQTIRGSVGTARCLAPIEVDAISECQARFRRGTLFDPLFAQTAPNLDDNYQWALIAQHFGYPTRLLDVSMDPLVALFFACIENVDVPGYVYCGHGNLNVLEHDQHSTGLHDLFDVDAIGDNRPADDTVCLFRPLPNNLRMSRQRAAFLWTRGVGYPCKPGDFEVSVKPDAKARIVEVLSRWGYTEEDLVPPQRRGTEP